MGAWASFHGNRVQPIPHGVYCRFVNRRSLPVLLAAFSMLAPFSIDTIFPAFSRLQEEFGVGVAGTQQLISMYILAFAVASLLHGPLSDALGRKPVIVVSLVVYSLASVASMWAPTFETLVALRAVQGISAGAGSTIGRAIVRDVYEGPEAQRIMSIIMMIFGLAPALAPIVGGALLSVGPWQGIYLFLCVFSVLLMVSTLVFLPETHPKERRVPLRLGALAADVARVGLNWRFLAVAMCGALAFSGMFLYIGSAAIVVTDLMGKGEQDFWMLFVPLIGGMMVGSFISSRLAGRVSQVRLVTVAFRAALAAAALNVLVAFLWQNAAPTLMVLTPGLIGLSVATMFPALQLAAIDMFPDARGAAASVSGFSSLIVNAATAGALAPFITSSFLVLASAALVFVAVGFGLSRVCVAHNLLNSK